jgi:parallel beta-helix repeat protein
MLALLVTTMLVAALRIQPVKAELATVITINADGSISQPTAPINTLDNVTYAFLNNVYEAIAVQRSNIVIDGNGYTLTPASGNNYGFNLTNVDNVTIANATIIASQDNIPGFLLANTNDSQIVSNNITGDRFGITYGYAISLTSCFGNNVSSNRGTGTTHGIALYSSGNNIVSNNHFDNGIFGGALLYSSNNNTLTGNHVSGYAQFSGPGGSVEGSFELSSSDNNKLIGNDVTGNGQGILLESSHNNVLIANDVTGNVGEAGGAQIHPSWGFGIYIESSSSNTIYHNNFIGNIIYEMYNTNPIVPNNVMSDGSPNMWDDGYPSGGNCWSDYNGTDLYSGPYQNQTGSDGIGDTPYAIDASNKDSHPLIGTFSSFDTQLGNVCTISNSTISNLSLPTWLSSPYDGLEPGQTFIQFFATGQNGSVGFCRLMFPRIALNSSSYIVMVDGVSINATQLPMSNSTYVYLYFIYTHSKHEVIVTIPEFPSIIILPLFMLFTLLATVIIKRRELTTQS